MNTVADRFFDNVVLEHYWACVVNGTDLGDLSGNYGIAFQRHRKDNAGYADGAGGIDRTVLPLTLLVDWKRAPVRYLQVE